MTPFWGLGLPKVSISWAFSDVGATRAWIAVGPLGLQFAENFFDFSLSAFPPFLEIGVSTSSESHRFIGSMGERLTSQERPPLLKADGASVRQSPNRCSTISLGHKRLRTMKRFASMAVHRPSSHLKQIGAGPVLRRPSPKFRGGGSKKSSCRGSSAPG